MTEHAMLRHIRAVVAELDACRANAQPGGKYGPPLAQPAWLPRPYTAPDTGVCFICGGEYGLQADGAVRAHGPYGDRCTGSHHLPLDEGDLP